MKTVLLSTLAFVVAAAAAGQAPPVLFPAPMSPRNANYAIDVTLDAGTHLLRGREHIRWRNITDAPASDAWFHLYQNAFANTESVFNRESGGRLRGDRFDQKHWGYCIVTAIAAVAGGRSIPLTQEFPGADRTVMRVRLPGPVPPGGEADFDVTFETQLPKVFARSGYAGTFDMAGQWFPKLGVFQGTKGWNCHAYHANSEFFSDFGVYDVAVTVPESYTVGGTGVLWQEKKKGKEKTVRFHAEDVHDFAWAASPDFVDFNDSWEGVKIRILMQPGDRASIPRYDAAVKKSLECFARWIWKYPYQQITIVDPPMNGEGAGGMEYPTLITAGASPFIPKSLLLPEMVVVHEFGHQYWYGMEADNESEEAWLDEGINSYYEARILDDWYGSHDSIMNGLLGLHMGDGELQRIGYISMPDLDPIVLDSWKYVSNRSYSVITYDKTAMVLKTLEGILGRDEMDRVMRAFFMQVKFTHPTTEDFLRIVSLAAGRDLGPLLRPMFYGTSTVDFKVARVNNRRRGEPDGLDLTVTPPKPYASEKTAGKGAAAGAPKPAGAAGKGRAKPDYDSTVVVERKGALVVPVETLVAFDDGTSKRVEWDGEGRYRTFTFEGPKVVKVIVDPEGKVPLDVSRLDNGWMLRPDHAPAGSLATRFRLVFQGLCTLILNLV